MSPFDAGGPNIPSPPIDIPTPEIPRANFHDIGRDFERGRKDAQAETKEQPGWFDWVGGLVGLIVGSILGLIGRIIAELIRQWFKIFHAAEEGTDEISRQAIAGMFGIEVPSGNWSDITGAGSREATHKAISQLVLNGLFPGATGSAGGDIKPGHAGADNFINLSSRMAIEGWLQGWIFELASVGQVETFAELKDIIERTLGIGRLMRRVLAAPMKILLADPFTWELNSRYHPTLLQPGELVREYLRGRLDRDQLQARMDYHGYSSENVTALINTGKLHLSSAQLLTLELHSSRTQADTLAALQAQGYDADTAAQVRFVELQGRVDTWNLAIVNELAAAVVDRKADIARLDEFMQEAGLPKLEQALIHLLTENKLSFNRTRFTMSEATTMVEKGIWNLDQFQELATYHGYSASDARDLELLLLGKIKDKSDADAKRAAADKARATAAQLKADAAAKKAADAKAAAEAAGVSIALYETLVTDGLRTLPQYRAFLVSKGIAADNADALTTVLQGKLDKAKAAAQTKADAATKAKAKGLDLAQLEAATKAGILSVAEFEARVIQSGVAEADAQILVSTLTDQVDQAKAKADATAAAKAQAAAKRINLTEEERAVRLGLASVDDYGAFLVAHGYTDEDAALLVSELSAQLAADAAAKQQKAAIAAALKSKGLSLPDLERAVRAGVKTIADYRQALAAAGYDSAAQDALVSLLQLQIDQDKATLVVKGTASALLDQRGVSLADLERAVKLGVVPLSVYADALARSGVSAADAQILTLSLAAAAKQAKASAATSATASKLLAARGLSLADLESGTLAGRLTVSQLSAQLAGAGVSAADAAAIVGLVSEELANQAAGAAKVADAKAKAAAKHLDLAQAVASVKADVTTLPDFEKFVGDLGYDAADVQIIVATLASQLGAAAAKKAAAGQKKTPAAAPVV